MDATLAWEALAWPGIEHLHIQSGPTGILADGLVVAVEQRPLRLHYRLRCDPDWTARELTVEDAVSEIAITLRSDGAGRWTDQHGTALDALQGCIDVDIAATPFTNTLPVRRIPFEVGQSRDLRMAYVTVPELTVVPADQRYTCLDKTPEGALYRYESGSFKADIRVDREGLVVDYPGLWRRRWPA